MCAGKQPTVPEIFPSLYHRFVGLTYCKNQSIILQNDLCHSLRLVLVDHEEDDWGKGHPELRSHMSETRKSNSQLLTSDSYIAPEDIITGRSFILSQYHSQRPLRQGRPFHFSHPSFRIDFLWLDMEDRSRQGACSECQRKLAHLK